MGNAGVGRVGQEALQEAIAGTVFLRPPEDHLLCGFAQQSRKQQHHNRHVQSEFRHERLKDPRTSAYVVNTMRGGCRGLLFGFQPQRYTRTHINIIIHMHRRA